MKSAVVIIFNEENKVLLLERMTPQISYAGFWGLPGGAIHHNELPKDAAIREAKEETSLNILDLKFVCEVKRDISVYTCRSFTGTVQLDFEHVDFIWTPIEKIDDYKTIPGTKELILNAQKL